MANPSAVATGNKLLSRSRARVPIASHDSRGKIAHTILEAVKATGLSRSMLYVAIARGALLARKCGARTLILDSDLRRFLRSLPALAEGDTALPTEEQSRRGRPRKHAALAEASTPLEAA